MYFTIYWQMNLKMSIQRCSQGGKSGCDHGKEGTERAWLGCGEPKGCRAW